MNLGLFCSSQHIIMKELNAWNVRRMVMQGKTVTGCLAGASLSLWRILKNECSTCFMWSNSDLKIFHHIVKVSEPSSKYYLLFLPISHFEFTLMVVVDLLFCCLSPAHVVIAAVLWLSITYVIRTDDWVNYTECFVSKNCYWQSGWHTNGTWGGEVEIKPKITLSIQTSN